MKITLKIITPIFVLLCLALSPVTSLAQFELPKSADLLSVKMIPSVPKPFDHVVIDLQSFLTDLDKAMISWTLGNIKKVGRGEKHFEFDAGDVGSNTTVNISITTAEGEVVSRNITVRPGNVDMLWEASTYTPPLYRGKALYTPQADIKVVAMPNIIDERGVKLASKDLIYKWTINGKYNDSASGFGKDFINITGPSVLKTLTIEVEASSLGGTVAEGSISLNETSPSLLFYEDNPILGIFYEKALRDQITLIGKEVTITAVPYFFSTLKKETGMIYNWTLNGTKVEGENKSFITLRKDTDEKGTASVGIEAKSQTKLFQMVRNSLLINFGETTDSSHPSVSF